MSIPTREAIEAHIENSINPHREVKTLEYTGSNAGEYLNYDYNKSYYYLMNQDIRWTKIESELPEDDHTKKIDMNIGRTSKHLTKLSSKIREVCRYGSGVYEPGIKTLLDHEAFPQTICFPPDLQKAIERYHQHYGDGFITLVGTDLAGAHEKVYRDGLTDLSKTYNTRIMRASGWYDEKHSKTNPINHGFWYKVFPRECFVAEPAWVYSVKLNRVSRKWELSMKFRRTMNFYQRSEIKGLMEIPGLAASKTSDRWKVL